MSHDDQPTPPGASQKLGVATSASARIKGLAKQMAAPSSTSPGQPIVMDDSLHPMLAMSTERKQTSFPVRALTYFIDGSEQRTLLREKIMTEIERDPMMRTDDHYDLSLPQVRKRTMEKVRSVVHYVTSESEESSFLRFSLIGIVDQGFVTRVGVHYALFFGAVRGSGTPDQLSYWLGRGAGSISGMFGCLAMTEMGHGSNVAGVETRATYDERSEQFIIHTPCLTATKWWIGGAAHTATHAVVIARLIVKGKDYGPKSFVVPLRDPEDYSLKPGVAIGDLGKKAGRDGIDNGYIQFSQVRIPRSYMLMKHTKVSKDGKVTEAPLAQLTYGALILGRVSMVNDSAAISKRVVTIAIRYAAIRRQFSATPGAPETKLLDYAMHQRRLIPLLVQTYALQFAADEILKMFNSLSKKLSKMDTSDKKGTAEVIESLKEVHVTSSGLKAFGTWACLEAIDKCRQACGGHGYSAYSGFGPCYNDFAVQCTWEGDNSILALQAGRSLVHNYLTVKKGKKVPGEGVAYLNRFEQLSTATANGRDLATEQVIREAWECVAVCIISKLGDRYEFLTADGMTADQAFEATSSYRFEAARIHTKCYLVSRFFTRIADAPADIKPVLTTMALLYGLWTMELDSGLFLEAGYLTGHEVEAVRQEVDRLCKEVRDDAIGLTDAFGYSDFFINSPLGKFDGDVYRAYFDKITRSNPPGQRAEYFESTIKPLLSRDISGDEVIEMEDDE